MKRFFLLFGTLILVSAVLMLIVCSTKPNDNPPSTDANCTEQSTAEQTMPEQMTPEQTTPEQTMSEQTTPEQTMSEQTIPEQTTPEQTMPEQTMPEQATPEETEPEQTTIPEEPVQVEYKCQYCNKAFDSEAEKNKHEANCPTKDQRQDNDPHKGEWDS